MLKQQPQKTTQKTTQKTIQKTIQKTTQKKRDLSNRLLKMYSIIVVIVLTTIVAFITYKLYLIIMSLKCKNPILLLAVKKAGGQAALARLLVTLSGKPIKQAHVWNWLNRDKQIPPEIALFIESATGVSRHKLCPEFPWDLQCQNSKTK